MERCQLCPAQREGRLGLMWLHLHCRWLRSALPRALLALPSLFSSETPGHPAAGVLPLLGEPYPWNQLAFTLSTNFLQEESAVESLTLASLVRPQCRPSLLPRASPRSGSHLRAPSRSPCGPTLMGTQQESVCGQEGLQPALTLGAGQRRGRRALEGRVGWLAGEGLAARRMALGGRWQRWWPKPLQRADHGREEAGSQPGEHGGSGEQDGLGGGVGGPEAWPLLPASLQQW